MEVMDAGELIADEKDGDGGLLLPALTDNPLVLGCLVPCGEPTGEVLRDVPRDSRGVSIFRSDSALVRAEGVEGESEVELGCELLDGGDEDGVVAIEDGKGRAVLIGEGECDED